MVRFLIKPDKYGQYEVLRTYPWWNIFSNDRVLVVIEGTIEDCFKRIYNYTKNNYIYKYTVKVKRY